MSRPSTPSKPTPSTTGTTRSHREDVLQFLDNLDSFDDVKAGSPARGETEASQGSSSRARVDSNNASKSAGPASANTANVATAPAGEDAQSVLDFLDEIVTSRERRVPASSSSAAAGSASGSKRPTSAASTAGITRSSSRTSLNNASSTASRKSTESTRGSSYLTPSSNSTSSPLAAAPSSQAAQTAEKLQETPIPSARAETAAEPATAAAGGGWGWGSVWSQASNAIQQARTVAEEQVSKNLQNLPKNLPTSISSLQAQLPSSSSLSAQQAQAQAQASSAASAATEQAQKWRSGMLNLLSTHVDIDKLRRDITETGLKAMNDIINAVAPPIAEHEVIEVNLSHDMLGYEGVETLVYRALAKVMEQVEGGDLVVNRGNVEDQPAVSKTGDDGGEERDLNTVEGFLEAYKLAEANLEALIKRNYRKPEQKATEGGGAEREEVSMQEKSGHGRSMSSSSVTSPVTICPVYMRIQPVLAPLPFSLPSSLPTTSSTSTPLAETSSSSPASNQEDRYLFFILLLRDPTNELVHKTLSQSMPSKWLDIPFEDNEWVEDIMVDVIRRGVEILGEEYVKGRMYGRSLKNAPAAEALYDEEEEKGGGEREEEEKGESERIAEAGVLA